MSNNRVGIQGGKGSFNHQGWLTYAHEHDLSDWEIVFLHTTKNVLVSLEKGDVSMGQFGIYNTLGGLVEETAHELGKYAFEITDWYKFPIAHFLMKKKGVDVSAITQIMAHPQGFKQCKANLEKLYPHLKQVTNTGDRIDHAKLAEDLANGSLEDTVCIIGPAMLAHIYGLEIIAENLQDDPKNLTTFVVVKPLAIKNL